MNARHGAARAGFGQVANRGDDALALAQQHLRPLAVLVALPGLLTGYCLESRLNAVFGLLRPIRRVPGRGNLDVIGDGPPLNHRDYGR